MNDANHYSVLLEESVSALIQNQSGVYVDGTYGRGGHTRAILSALAPDATVFGFDKDPEAISSAKALESEDSRFSAIHASFATIQQELESRSMLVDGVLLDLGVSSPQLDDAERGFSFMRDGPLDMRMDNSSGISAAQWVAETDERAMARVFKEFGEEKFSKRVARKIVEVRAEKEIDTTSKLAEVVKDAMPFVDPHKHPATRVFQAIRIEVNQELTDLHAALAGAMAVVKPGGRIVVISFHSLEDRIVKRFFRKYSQSQDYPLGVPVTHDMLKSPLSLIGRAIKAGDSELGENVRSRSAVMRIAERND